MLEFLSATAAARVVPSWLHVHHPVLTAARIALDIEIFLVLLPID
jgi:hypothetical protein